MTLKLAALSLALSLGATVVYAQDSIDPKTGKKRGPLEVWRDRDRPNKAPTTTPTPTPAPNPPRDISRIHDHDRDRDARYRIAHQRERREQIERERRARFEHERRERERRRRFEHARATDPDGWSRGRKTGWGNSNVPPGQAKKDGDRRHGHGHHKDRG